MISKYIYYKLLPVYIPKFKKDRKYLAIWCCINVKNSGNLWKVLKGIRITIRRNGCCLRVIKKGVK